ncbi:uncharacterized protein [Nicotiana tomentosiformis]|uniref:uncharacterized protein n=1 Tax=Nicotiana tomentosiformis TaxID=4098 RepID=UPI00388C5E33
MEIYIKSYDVKVWCVIKKENYPLPTADQPPADPEDIDEYTDEKMVVVQVNNKARNFLYDAISEEEYEKSLSCDTAKEMWDELEVTYEGASKRKIVALESQDLNKLSYGELRGDLIAFEKTHLKKTYQEEKKKAVAFKTTTEGPENDTDSNPESLEEEITMVSRNMDGLMRRYINTRRGRMPSKRTRKYNEQDKNDGKCYECGRYVHVQAECPDLKRKVSKGFNKNKSFRRWSNEDNSEHEEIANMYFMTILENNMNKYSGCWTDEDASDDECKEDTENCFMTLGERSEVRSYNYDRCNEIQDSLDLTLKESQRMLNELRRLNREKKDWELKLEVCEI